MRTGQFAALMEETWNTLNQISATKGQEYAHDVDRLANFKRLAGELNMTPEQVLWVYFTKHKDSIVSYIKDIVSPRDRAYPLSEPIEGRIDDAILYLILLKGLIRERNGVSEAAHAAVRLQGVLADRLQSDGERSPGPVVGGMGYRIVGGNKVVPEPYPRFGDSDGKATLFHEAAGGLAEESGGGERAEGRGDVADWHPV